MAHAHHGHHHSAGDSVSSIRAAFFLNLSFTVIEIVGGFLTNSVAILSDAVHDLGDSIALAVLRLRGGSKLNQRVVFLHLIEDVLGWLAVLVASIVMMFMDVHDLHVWSLDGSYTVFSAHFLSGRP